MDSGPISERASTDAALCYHTIAITELGARFEPPAVAMDVTRLVER